MADTPPPSSEQRLIGFEVDLGLAEDEVSQTLIRYWTEAFEDVNPLYTDREAATAGALTSSVYQPARPWRS